MATTSDEQQRYHLRAGHAASGPYALDIGPERAGWERSSLRVLELEPGGVHTLETGESEWIILPLSGGCTVRTAGEIFELLGRKDVFGAVTDFAYVPRDAGAQIASADTFDCDRLIAVEVLTPGGNWSSYPPHKHDEYHPGAESVLEEIYYFEVEDDGLGYHRVSPSREGGTDVLAEVATGDAVLIPDGWHGPSIAPPGRTLYYLNVMAGPGEQREWLIRDHPDHRWIRDTWPGRPVDPRLPLHGPEAAR